MEILFLGTGNAFASGGRNHMAILVRTPGLGVLLDCGPTALAGLKQRSREPSDVDLVLLSHHHGDHFGGLPLLVCHEHYASRRLKPLVVAGPRGTARLVAEANVLFFPGMDPFDFRLEVHDLEPNVAVSFGPARVRPFEVEHFSQGVALGFRLEVEGRVVVYSGDTAWTDALAEESRDADLFVCECSSFATPLARHMSHVDLKRHRKRIGARRTLLVHAGEDVIAHRNELVFELAEDGMQVTL